MQHRPEGVPVGRRADLGDGCNGANVGDGGSLVTTGTKKTTVNPGDGNDFALVGSGGGDVEGGAGRDAFWSADSLDQLDRASGERKSWRAGRV